MDTTEPENLFHIPDERFLRIISIVTSRWCNHRKESINGFTELDITLPVFAFAKMITFLARFWKNISLTSSDSTFILKSLDGYDESHAKHGPVVIKFGHNKGHHLIDILYNLSEYNAAHYVHFNIKDNVKYAIPTTTSLSSKYIHRGAFDFIMHSDAESYDVTVEGSKSVPSDDAAFLNEYFSPTKEIPAIQLIYSCINDLNSSEIRALGTHKDAIDTLTQIKKEYLSIINKNDYLGSPRKNILQNFINEFNVDSDYLHSAYSIRSFLEEAYNKAVRNESHYRNAYDLFLKKIAERKSTIDCHFAFMDSQASPDSIWSSPEIIAFKDYSQFHFNFFNLITLIGNSIKKNSHSPKVQEIYVGKDKGDNIKKIMTENHLAFPDKFTDIFEKSNGKIIIKSTYKKLILQSSNELLKWIANDIIL